MARNELRQWQAWSEDRQVSYACWNGCLQVRVADGGKSKRSEWCKLIGNSVDVTIRGFLTSLATRKTQADTAEGRSSRPCHSPRASRCSSSNRTTASCGAA
jgi:hypothetical protein